MGPRARANAMDVADEELHALYQWVDEIPLSRPKRNIARDFSDGVLVAELVSHYLPRFIDLHNYSGASNVTQKLYNWQTLNDKVFRRLGFSLGQRERENTANCKRRQRPGAHPSALRSPGSGMGTGTGTGLRAGRVGTTLRWPSLNRSTRFWKPRCGN